MLVTEDDIIHIAQDYSDSVMIALLPTSTEWCKQDKPHLTLVYAGKVSDLKPGDFNSLAKDASALSMMMSPISLRVKGVDVFGDGSADSPKVDVLTLEPTSDLLAMRHFVEQWSASDFDFAPHCTVGPQGVMTQPPPFALGFDRIEVCWGNDYLTFGLTGQNRY